MKPWKDLTPEQQLQYGEALYEAIVNRATLYSEERFDMDLTIEDETELELPFKVTYSKDRIKTFVGDYNRGTQDEFKTDVFVSIDFDCLPFFIDHSFTLDY